MPKIIKAEEVTKQQYRTAKGMGIPEDSYLCNDCWFDGETNDLLGFSHYSNGKLCFYKMLWED